MSENGSVKRKSCELDHEETLNDVNEPEPKQPKVETEVTEPNLENSLLTESPEKPENESQSDNNPETNQINNSESPNADCDISIKFHSDETANLYRTSFLNFLSTFPELHLRNEGNLCIDVYRGEEAIVGASEVAEIVNQSSSSKKRKKRSKVKKELFMLDATPSPNANGAELRYTTKFTISTEKSVEEEKRCFKSGPSCFNCGDSHSLKDCPHPKNYTNINAAKQRMKNPNLARYHSEESQKYSHLAPGKISKELKKALGLYNDEAPHYIYLMRKLGYPPGWLEEAKIEHSNLDMFDIDGKNVKTKVGKQGLDESKIVEYPGFNVPFEDGIVDDYKKYGVVPYSDVFNKQAMIEFYDKICVKDPDLETCEMDLGEAPVLKEISHTERNSPSLVDLEQQKQQLLEELNEEPKVETKIEESGFLAVKTSCFGTPILKSSSPYSVLPDPDNFSKDVSPVINFENLPNSTGKYEQLSDVLQKVRSTLKKKQE